MGAYLTLAWSGLFMTCLELWCYQSMQFMSGSISVKCQAVITIVISIIDLLFYLPQGFSYATSALVGASLSKGNPGLTKKIIRLNLIMTNIVVVGMFYFLTVHGEVIVSIYTQDPELVDSVVAALSIYAVLFVLDANQIILGGVVRGIGLQVQAQNLALISYLLVGLPSCYLMGIYLEFGFQGLLYGQGLGLLFILFLLGQLIASTDFEEESFKICRNLADQSEKLDQPLIPSKLKDLSFDAHQRVASV